MRRVVASSMMLGALAMLHQGCGSPSEAAPTPVTCFNMGCSSGLGFETRLDAAQDLRLLKFTICHNGTCATASPDLQGDAAIPSSIYCVYDPTMGCYLHRRADGAMDAIVSLHFDYASAVDGDTATFRVEDTTKATPLLDVVRQVTYGTFQPNGPKCEPTCKGAGGYLTAASVSNIRCDSNGCSSGATFRRKVSLVGRPKTLVACRNDVCVESPLQWDSAGTGGTMFPGPLDGWRALLAPHDATSFDLQLNCPARPDEVANGDRYTLRGSSGQGFIDRIVDYDSSYPNGQACDTLACMQVDVTLP